MAATSTTDYENALIHETSPYLRQHAHNPVNWYPWSSEALELAKQQDKPILLSIGYSACHWCHVMAHESFENPAIATVMNQHFINIKVDREERPDLDKIYQAAHQMLTQRGGGWPLTMFLSPDNHYPFFGGTYFPPEARFNLPAFPDLLHKVADYFHQHRTDITQQNSTLAQHFVRYEASKVTTEVTITSEVLDEARRLIATSYDERYGGFSGAPKFPHLFDIERLLHHYTLTKQQGEVDKDGLKMALHTLRMMALGGIYDQLGGGFCRYSVDELWMIPHFEKMLYDNGLFLQAYSTAWQILSDDLFERVVHETVAWVLREMQASEGGFYSSLDADSEGEEGKFYVWTSQQVKALLDEDSAALLSTHFGLDRRANFEGQWWHLHVFQERQALTKQFQLDAHTLEQRLDAARAKLFEARRQRVAPGRDDKILVSWNALMIKGLAVASRVFQRSAYAEAATRAVDFIRNTMWHERRLFATYKDGKAHLNAYLDDYAFLLDALLALLQVRWRSEDMQFAIALAEVLLEEFEDSEQGGFFFTGHQHENLISRPKPLSDDALPSGNAVAAFALGRLGHALGETRYLDAAERTLKAAWRHIEKMPFAHCSLLLAVADYLLPPTLVVLRGEGETLQTWQRACQTGYQPQQWCLAIPNDAQNLPKLLAARSPEGEVVAYVCSGTSCKPPIRDLDTLLKSAV